MSDDIAADLYRRVLSDGAKQLVLRSPKEVIELAEFAQRHLIRREKTLHEIAEDIRSNRMHFMGVPVRCGVGTAPR